MTPNMAEWIRSRTPRVQQLMLAFPPHCVVRGAHNLVELVVPAEGKTAEVMSYSNDGELLVVGLDAHGVATRAFVWPESIQLIQCVRGYSPEDVRRVIAGIDDLQGPEVYVGSMT